MPAQAMLKSRPASREPRFGKHQVARIAEVTSVRELAGPGSAGTQENRAGSFPFGAWDASSHGLCRVSAPEVWRDTAVRPVNSRGPCCHEWAVLS